MKTNIAELHAGNLGPRKPEVDLPPLEVEDRRARSLRFHASREAERQQERTQRREAEAEHVRQQQEAAEQMAAFSELQQQILGELVAEIRKQLRDEIQTAVGELRAEFNVMRSVDRGDVIDLPALPLRRRNDAA